MGSEVTAKSVLPQSSAGWGRPSLISRNCLPAWGGWRGLQKGWGRGGASTPASRLQTRTGVRTGPHPSRNLALDHAGLGHVRLRSRGGGWQVPPPPSAAAVTPTQVCCRHFFSRSSGASATCWCPGKRSVWAPPASTRQAPHLCQHLWSLSCLCLRADNPFLSASPQPRLRSCAGFPPKAWAGALVSPNLPPAGSWKPAQKGPHRFQGVAPHPPPPPLAAGQDTCLPSSFSAQTPNLSLRRTLQAQEAARGPHLPTSDRVRVTAEAKDRVFSSSAPHPPGKQGSSRVAPASFSPTVMRQS